MPATVKISLIACVLILLLGVGYVAVVSQTRPGTESPPVAEAAPIPLPGDVAAYGRIEPAGGIRNVAGPAGERVTELLVEVGEQVTAGQPVARMESFAIRKSELLAIDAQIAEAEAAEDDVRDSSDLKRRQAEITVSRTEEPVRLALEAAELQVEIAEAALDDARQMDQKLQTLSRQPSPRQLDASRLRVLKAEKELAAAELQLRQAEAEAQQGREEASLGGGAADIEQRSGMRQLGLPVLEAKRDVARAAAERSEVASPIDGEVVDVITHAGEAPNARPILRIANLERLVVIAEVFEGDVRRVQVGDPAVIKSDAFGQGELSGHVESVGRIVGPNSVRSLNPMAPADRRVVEVIVDLDRGDEIAAGLLGLQVEVKIDVADEAPQQTDTATDTATDTETDTDTESDDEGKDEAAEAADRDESAAPSEGTVP